MLPIRTIRPPRRSAFSVASVPSAEPARPIMSRAQSSGPAGSRRARVALICSAQLVLLAHDVSR